MSELEHCQSATVRVILCLGLGLAAIPCEMLGSEEAAIAAVNTVAPTSTTQGAASHPLSSVYLVKLVFSLLLVITLVYLASKLMRYVNPASLRNRRLCVVESIMLGQRERAVIVRVDGVEYLLGVSAGGVTRLDTLATTIPVPQPTLAISELAEATRDPAVSASRSAPKPAKADAGIAA